MTRGSMPAQSGTSRLPKTEAPAGMVPAGASIGALALAAEDHSTVNLCHAVLAAEFAAVMSSLARRR